jgi:histidine triad (HIT) family protein
MNCIFCEIIAGKAGAAIIYENDKTISFLDINPLNLGHTLVIPKNHYPDFLSIPQDELDYLINAAQIVTGAVNKSLRPDGINLVSNNGKAAGQSVFHFHFHIIPRFNSDNFKFKPVFKKYNSVSMEVYAEKIRQALNNKGV